MSLNCTHFGYARPLWEETFERLGYPGVKVLDPNPLMTDLVLREGGARRYPETKVTVEVVSKTPITPDVKAALGALLRTTSPATADALERYTHVPDLFHVEIDAVGARPLTGGAGSRAHRLTSGGDVVPYRVLLRSSSPRRRSAAAEPPFSTELVARVRVRGELDGEAPRRPRRDPLGGLRVLGRRAGARRRRRRDALVLRRSATTGRTPLALLPYVARASSLTARFALTGDEPRLARELHGAGVEPRGALRGRRVDPGGGPLGRVVPRQEPRRARRLRVRQRAGDGRVDLGGASLGPGGRLDGGDARLVGRDGLPRRRPPPRRARGERHGELRRDGPDARRRERLHRERTALLLDPRPRRDRPAGDARRAAALPRAEARRRRLGALRLETTSSSDLSTALSGPFAKGSAIARDVAVEATWFATRRLGLSARFRRTGRADVASGAPGRRTAVERRDGAPSPGGRPVVRRRHASRSPSRASGSRRTTVAPPSEHATSASRRRTSRVMLGAALRF